MSESARDVSQKYVLVHGRFQKAVDSLDEIVHRSTSLPTSLEKSLRELFDAHQRELAGILRGLNTGWRAIADAQQQQTRELLESQQATLTQLEREFQRGAEELQGILSSRTAAMVHSLDEFTARTERIPFAAQASLEAVLEQYGEWADAQKQEFEQLARQSSKSAISALHSAMNGVTEELRALTAGVSAAMNEAETLPERLGEEINSTLSSYIDFLEVYKQGQQEAAKELAQSYRENLQRPLADSERITVTLVQQAERFYDSFSKTQALEVKQAGQAMHAELKTLNKSLASEYAKAIRALPSEIRAAQAEAAVQLRQALDAFTQAVQASIGKGHAALPAVTPAPEEAATAIAALAMDGTENDGARAPGPPDYVGA